MDGWNTLIVAAVCKLFLRSPILTICLTFLEGATSMGAVLVWLKKNTSVYCNEPYTGILRYTSYLHQNVSFRCLRTFQ